MLRFVISFEAGVEQTGGAVIYIEQLLDAMQPPPRPSIPKSGKHSGTAGTVASQGSKSPSHHIQGLKIAIKMGIRHLGFASISQSQLLCELWGGQHNWFTHLFLLFLRLH